MKLSTIIKAKKAKLLQTNNARGRDRLRRRIREFEVDRQLKRENAA